ncbi:MAG: glycosyltransferase family 2 protein [Desulfuromonadales bacterium]|nr:glycosyltransferase family 2 protein [Desulfuromonadales bacterium]
MAIKSQESISIVFPAYNEEENIAAAISQAVDFVSDVFADYEVIVVNDGSADKTGAIVEEISRQNPRVKVVHHEVNKGYGRALTSGFECASMDLVFFCDSDLQFHLYELLLFLNWINSHDIVVGYRARRVDPFYRLLNAYGWKMLVRLMLGLKVRDIDCAFKVFRREVFDYIKIDAVGAMVNTDILVQAQCCGFKIKELPVTHFPRTSGEQTGANLRVILKAFRELYLLRGKLKNIQPVVEDYDARQHDSGECEQERRLEQRRKVDLPINFPCRRQRKFLRGPAKGQLLTLKQAGLLFRSKDAQDTSAETCADQTAASRDES